MAKIAVTGAAGFIGSHAVEHFSSVGHRVVGCDNFYRFKTLGHFVHSGSYNWNYLKEKYPTVIFHKVDVRDFRTLRAAVRGADSIVHTAGQVAVTKSLQDPRTDFEINALGTFNVLEAARTNDASVMFCSTNKIYGENVNTIPVKEHPQRYAFDDQHYQNGIPETFSVDRTGHSPYGSSKLAADIYVQDYAHTYGLKTAVFRMSCIYGERQFGVEDQGWLAWFVTACLTRQPITIYGDGKQVRDVLYVKDLTDAFDRFFRSNIKHGVYNMGGGPNNTLSLLELLDLIKKKTGHQPRLKHGPWRTADQKVYVSDIRNAQESLSWRPTTSPIEGVAKVIEWVETNKELFG